MVWLLCGLTAAALFFCTVPEAKASGAPITVTLSTYEALSPAELDWDIELQEDLAAGSPLYLSIPGEFTLDQTANDTTLPMVFDAVSHEADYEVTRIGGRHVIKLTAPESLSKYTHVNILLNGVTGVKLQNPWNAGRPFTLFWYANPAFPFSTDIQVHYGSNPQQLSASLAAEPAGLISNLTNKLVFTVNSPSALQEWDYIHVAVPQQFRINFGEDNRLLSNPNQPAILLNGMPAAVIGLNDHALKIFVPAGGLAADTDQTITFVPGALINPNSIMTSAFDISTNRNKSLRQVGVMIDYNPILLSDNRGSAAGVRAEWSAILRKGHLPNERIGIILPSGYEMPAVLDRTQIYVNGTHPASVAKDGTIMMLFLSDQQTLPAGIPVSFAVYGLTNPALTGMYPFGLLEVGYNDFLIQYADVKANTGGGGTLPGVNVKGGQYEVSPAGGILDLRILNPELTLAAYQVQSGTGPFFGTLLQANVTGVYQYVPDPMAPFRGWDSFFFQGSNASGAGTALVWVGRDLDQTPSPSELNGLLVDGAVSGPDVLRYDITATVLYHQSDVNVTLPSGASLLGYDGQALNPSSLTLQVGDNSYMLRVAGPNGTSVYRLHIRRLSVGPELTAAQILDDGRSVNLIFSEELTAFDPSHIYVTVGSVRSRLSDLMSGGHSLYGTAVKLRLRESLEPGAAGSFEILSTAATGAYGRAAAGRSLSMANHSKDYNRDNRLDISDLLRMSQTGSDPEALRKAMRLLTPRFYGN